MWPKRYLYKVIEDFGSDGDPDILIVLEKLLTGFDEPRNAVPGWGPAKKKLDAMVETLTSE